MNTNDAKHLPDTVPCLHCGAPVVVIAEEVMPDCIITTLTCQNAPPLSDDADTHGQTHSIQSYLRLAAERGQLTPDLRTLAARLNVAVRS